MRNDAAPRSQGPRSRGPRVDARARHRYQPPLAAVREAQSNVAVGVKEDRQALDKYYLPASRRSQMTDHE
jgi:hypothetical protein